MKEAFTEVITEAGFLKLAQEHSQNFLKIYNSLPREHAQRTRRFYARLIEESEELESFLDDHCARENKTWQLFGELVACIRNLAKVAFILKHILNRYPSYSFSDEKFEKFLSESEKLSTFLDETIISLFDDARKESTRLGIKFPTETLEGDLFVEIYPQKRLPYTLDEEEDSNDQTAVAKVASLYLNMIERFEFFKWHRIQGISDDNKNIIPDKVNEERARELIVMIHNLQSTYDHDIKNTPLELQDDSLKRFRSHISMPLHLLNIVNWLAHLCQRHLSTTGFGNGRDVLSDIIDESKLANIIVDFALYYINDYLQAGKILAGEILEKYVVIGTCAIKVPEGLGFHLRPANLIAKLAKHYGTELSLIVDGKEYDASSVLSVTLAAGFIARKGFKEVHFRGDSRVLHDLRLLSEYNFGEDDKGSPATLPPELPYLWT